MPEARRLRRLRRCFESLRTRACAYTYARACVRQVSNKRLNRLNRLTSASLSYSATIDGSLYAHRAAAGPLSPSIPRYAYV